jgi:non-specific serine/threonine protein kinase
VDEERTPPFSQNLRQHRLAAGLTQEALAERAGLGVRSIQALERSESRPHRDTARALAAGLGLDQQARAAFLVAATPTPRHPTSRGPRSERPPRASAATNSRHNLPASLSSLIGRETERGEVGALLRAGRLLTLTGSGGVGKTRLALAVAGELVGHYPGGVWLVELAGLADPGLVPGAVAQVLGVSEEVGRPLAATLTDHLRQKQMLLVLDNCEHLVGACAALAGALLRACPQLHILATSREGLEIAGEQCYRVPSLPVPNLAHLPPPGRLAESAVVALFLARARERRTDFVLTAQNARAVAQVCARLDGIPLAIELAAARVGSLSVEGIAARLDSRFRLLAGGARDALPRQRTLRAALDWSYNLLSAPEQLLLDRLSVFAGGCTLAAATAVCAEETVADWEVLDLLDRLVNKSLVQTDVAGGDARYGLLETVRQYGQERLATAGQAEAVRDQHLAHFLALAEEAALHLAGADQVAWLDRLEAEHDNLRLALNWVRERGAAEAGLRLAAAIMRFWWTRGYLGEGRRWLEGVLAADDGSAPLARIRVLTAAGTLAGVHGDTARAVTLLDESLARARDLGDRQGVARSLSLLGFVTGWQGDLARAWALFEEALGIARDLGDQQEIAFALFGLGDTAYPLGNLARAATFYEEALALFREMGDWQHVGIVLGDLGVATYAQGNPVRAATLFEEARALYHRLGERWHIIMTTGHLADVALGQGDVRRGAALYAECLALARDAGIRPQIARGLEGLACVAMQVGPAGDPRRAARLLSAAVALGAGGWTPMRIEPDRPERVRAAARAALGEEAFAATWAEGQALSQEEAVAHALRDTEAILHGE